MHLLDLARVGADGAQARAPVRRDELDVLADQAPQHRLRVGDSAFRSSDLRRQDLLAAEGELAGQRGGAVARLL